MHKHVSPSPDRISSRPGVGRPSRAQQAQRYEELLDAALDIFLDQGFEQASIEKIAKHVGMSKQTVYARFEDKTALYQAAIQRAIERYTVPHERIEALVTDDLRETLIALGRMRIANATTPTSIKLQRILMAQANRFPDPNQIAFERGAGPIVEVLTELFQRHAARGEINVFEPDYIAQAFLDLVVSRIVRSFMLGGSLNQAEIESRIAFAVELLLNGIVKR